MRWKDVSAALVVAPLGGITAITPSLCSKLWLWREWG